VGSGTATTADLASILDDADPFVRREGAAGLASTQVAARDSLLTRALADRSPAVRYEALRALARSAEPGAACAPIIAAVRDPGPHVALLAIDLLAPRCNSAATAMLLDSIAGSLPRAETGWHAAAHAFVSLAIVNAERARSRLPDFVEHPSFFVRAYAARAADTLRDTQTLLRLARDAHPNVRAAAVEGLARTVGHAADSIFIAQLNEDDSQLVQAAAAALSGTRHSAALDRLLAAFVRISAQNRETLRDARRALLDRIAELGSPATVERLSPYLRDYDPAIATEAAEIIGRWTGDTPNPAPAPLPRQPLPTAAELIALAGARVIIEMEGGDTIELALRPFDAPTNAARFARLARTGYYDGLTFHRIAPNFVVQGGSPNANEFAGDGPYTRDELVIDGNWRATVGLSTRGRDTGDAQLYINLIDNIRLDHNYTVFAEVVRGMNAVDRMPEGAVMRRVTVVTSQ
jgi:cyclophilin family peptidyl-prolyl cis-trans isomerase